MFNYRYPTPSPSYTMFVSAVLAARKMVLRNFALPRPYFLRFRILSEKPDKKTGRYYRSFYETEPW